MFSNMLVSGLYILKYYWGRQRAFTYLDCICQCLLNQKLKPRNLKNNYVFIDLKITIIKSLHVNRKKHIFFMNHSYIFRIKTVLWEGWFCFIFLQLSLMSGLIKGPWVFISTSAFNLGWSIRENVTSHRYVAGKGRSILVAFLDNSVYIFCSTPELKGQN